MRKALRDFDRKRKAEGVETLEDPEQSLNSVQCQGIWENLQVMTQEIVKEINVMKDERELEGEADDDEDDLAAAAADAGEAATPEDTEQEEETGDHRGTFRAEVMDSQELATASTPQFGTPFSPWSDHG